MGIHERRERERIERRGAILNSARELILSHGIEQVSMEDIAGKAELSKATLYLYFSGKDEIFNEICEESAKCFLEHFKPIPETNITGMEALKVFWSAYVNQFGNTDEIIIIFRVRNFLSPGMPFVSMEGHGKSHYVDAILKTMKDIIDQCKNEGSFDPNLDSQMATRLLLSIFSISIDNAARLPDKHKKAALLLEEMRKTFQVLIYGFAKEGIDRSSLNISG